MTTKEQISATGAQLYARLKRIEMYLQQNDIENFKDSADALYDDLLSFVEEHPDYAQTYEVYCTIVFSLSELYSGLDTEQDLKKAVEILAYSMEKLGEFAYPDALKYEYIADLCMINSIKLCHTLSSLCASYNADVSMLHSLLEVVVSVYNRARALHHSTSFLNSAHSFLQDIQAEAVKEMIRDRYSMTKEDLVQICHTIKSNVEVQIVEIESDDFLSFVLQNRLDALNVEIEKMAAEMKAENQRQPESASPAVNPAQTAPQYTNASSSQKSVSNKIVKGFLRNFIGVIFAVASCYVLFASPVSIIARWPVMTVNQASWYVLACPVGLIIAWILGVLISKSFDYSRDYFPAFDMCYSLPLGMWAAYGMVRLYPALAGVWSWIFFILFAAIFVFSIFFLIHTVEDIEWNLYKKNMTSVPDKLNRKAYWIISAFYLIFTAGVFLPLVMTFDYAHKTLVYHHGEYHELIETSVRYFEEEDYQNARTCLEQALARKTNDKRKGIVTGYIQVVDDMREKRIPELKSEVKDLLDKLKGMSFKNGKPEEELALAQQKIDILRKNVPDDPEIDKFQTRLDYHKSRTR